MVPILNGIKIPEWTPEFWLINHPKSSQVQIANVSGFRTSGNRIVTVLNKPFAFASQEFAVKFRVASAFRLAPSWYGSVDPRDRWLWKAGIRKGRTSNSRHPWRPSWRHWLFVTIRWLRMYYCKKQERFRTKNKSVWSHKKYMQTLMYDIVPKRVKIHWIDSYVK